MTIFFLPVFFTQSTTLLSSQALINVRLMGVCSGHKSVNPLTMYPPLSSITEVNNVGTLNTLPVLPKPITLFKTVWLLALPRGPNWNGWCPINKRAQLSGVSNGPSRLNLQEPCADT